MSFTTLSGQLAVYNKFLISVPLTNDTVLPFSLESRGHCITRQRNASGRAFVWARDAIIHCSLCVVVSGCSRFLKLNSFIMTRKRSPNFLQSEKELFTTLLDEFSSKIECKKTDAMTQNEKAKAWEKLLERFNSPSTYIERSVDNLKSLWDNLKAQARKAVANEKQDLYRTGMYDHNSLGAC